MAGLSRAGRVIQAAGTVLWRPGPAGAEIALVHRPKYDDWSLPKGKCEDGEHPAVTAVRETAEECGGSGPLGRYLGRVRYDVQSADGPVPKSVRYWAMQDLGGVFTPNAEVDRVQWLPPEQALGMLSRADDRAPVRAFASRPSATTSVLLIRHAHAGRRSRWKGPDEQRPLDGAGRRQSRDIAAVAPCWAVTAVGAADVVRCTQTVTPLAAALGVAVEPEPSLSETAYAKDPMAALAVLRAAGAQPGNTAICSQGRVIPGLLETLSGTDGIRLSDVRARKGSVWCLSFADGILVSADYLASAAPLRGPATG